MCNLCDFAWPGTAKAHDKAANSQRRNFLRAGAVAAAAPWSLGSALAAPAAGDAAPNAIPPAEALKRLMDGNARLFDRQYSLHSEWKHRFRRSRIAFAPTMASGDASKSSSVSNSDAACRRCACMSGLNDSIAKNSVKS